MSERLIMNQNIDNNRRQEENKRLEEIAKMLDQTTKLVKSEKNHNPMQRTQDTQWQASSSSQQSYPASQLNINGPYRSLSF